jgi:hypothetical protein
MKRGVRLPGVNGELAAAVRRVNALRCSVPERHRREISTHRWLTLQAELDWTCTAGDVESALTAIKAWEAEASRPFTEFLLNAPLDEPA